MSQFILTQDDYIDERTLYMTFPDRVTQIYRTKKIGVCWVNTAFKDAGGAERIIACSSDVTSKQSINGKALIGSFVNKHPSNQHFSSEGCSPQVYGKLESPNGLDIYLFDQDFNPIKRSHLQHISICITLLDSMDGSYLINISGEVVRRGDSYQCTIPFDGGLQVVGGTKVGLQEIVIPEMVSDKTGKVIIGDEAGGVLQTTLRSDIVSTSNLFGDTILRSFCLPIGRRFYSSPYIIMSTAAPGLFNNLSFKIDCVTCDGLRDFHLRGKINLTLLLSQ